MAESFQACYPSFHCGLYCRAVSVTDNLFTKQGNSSFLGLKSAVYDFEWFQIKNGLQQCTYSIPFKEVLLQTSLVRNKTLIKYLLTTTKTILFVDPVKPRLLLEHMYWLKKARCSVLFRPSALSCGYLMLICMIFENKFQSHPGAFKN